MSRVYVVEDEQAISDIVVQYLRKEGYETRAFLRGDVALQELLKDPPDVAILDIMLPGLDGLEILKEVRKSLYFPVIFLTSRKDEIDQILGLETGADDYMTKPFSPKALMARIKALLRRVEYINAGLEQNKKREMNLRQFAVPIQQFALHARQHVMPVQQFAAPGTQQALPVRQFSMPARPFRETGDSGNVPGALQEIAEQRDPPAEPERGPVALDFCHETLERIKQFAGSMESALAIIKNSELSIQNEKQIIADYLDLLNRKLDEKSNAYDPGDLSHDSRVMLDSIKEDIGKGFHQYLLAWECAAAHIADGDESHFEEALQAVGKADEIIAAVLDRLPH